ncbi:MAG: nucleotide pyrophosphohydrolase [Candidatus Bathyarchaeia archaeon]
MSLTLKESQKRVDKWIQQFEEGYWPPLAMFASLVEEVGELGREINNIERYKIKRETQTSALDVEVGDVLFSLICIANYFKIDMEDAFLKTLEKYTKRDTHRWTPKKR